MLFRFQNGTKQDMVRKNFKFEITVHFFFWLIEKFNVWRNFTNNISVAEFTLKLIVWLSLFKEIIECNRLSNNIFLKVYIYIAIPYNIAIPPLTWRKKTFLLKFQMQNTNINLFICFSFADYKKI